MLTVESPLNIVPWWIQNKAPWSGEIFSNMILQPDDAEEQRIQAIRASMLPHYKGGKRRLSVEQALIITSSYQKTEGLHPAIRRAKAMSLVFQNIPIAVLPQQLLMGTASSGPHIVDFTPTFIPLSLEEWGKEKDIKSALKGAESRYIFPSEDQRVFQKEIWPHWKKHSRENYFFNELSRHYPDTWFYMRFSQTARYSPLVGGGMAHSLQDYSSILHKGLVAIQEEIKGYIRKLDESNPDDMGTYERRNQYEAILIVSDGMITYANRNAELAEKIADEENNPDRSTELRQMARICRRVPAYPAETWWEALQSFHFLRAATAMMEGADSHSAGRFDQYMLPFLQRDLASGNLTRPKAQELLECFFLKWNETRAFKLKMSVGSAGGGNNDKLNIGGINTHGRDSTNELSYMLLEAHAHVHLTDPNLSVRLHRNTSDEFLRKVLEVLRLGGGLPILINDDVIVPALISRYGMTLEHARNYGDVGCQENLSDPNMTGADTAGRTNTGWINLPKPIELALFNGVNPTNGKQVGPLTGNPRKFTSMDQFLEAVRKQIEYAVKMNVIANNVYDYVYTRNFPCVFHNLMYPGPRSTGVDTLSGGCKYNGTGCLAVGMANAGDMLTAIDYLIYKKQEVSWDELLTALECNWEGSEELRQRFIAAPKYGCDNEYADKWAKTMLGIWFDAYEQHTTPRGGHFMVGLLSMGNYVSMGKWMGATPDGRKRGDSLADATNPTVYAPQYGPTAALRSAARAIDAYHTPNGVTFNQRFDAASVMSPREVSKWADLVRSYIDNGGQQVQYTIVDTETLRMAQDCPEEYRDLFVRVGGYSAVFIELSKEVQNSIIARAESTL